jgi:hypothetical protein
MTNCGRIHVIMDNEIIWVELLNSESIRQVPILLIIDFYHEMKYYLTQRIPKIFDDHTVWEQIWCEQVLSIDLIDSDYLSSIGFEGSRWVDVTGE